MDDREKGLLICTYTSGSTLNLEHALVLKVFSRPLIGAKVVLEVSVPRVWIERCTSEPILIVPPRIRHPEWNTHNRVDYHPVEQQVRARLRQVHPEE